MEMRELKTKDEKHIQEQREMCFKKSINMAIRTAIRSPVVAVVVAVLL